MGFERVSVSDLLKGPGNRRELEVSVPVEISMDDSRVNAPATGVILLESMSGGLLASGTVALAAAFTCQRCLKDFGSTIVAEVSQVFGNMDDPDVVPIGPDGRIDLASAVHDEACLAVPNTPICRDDCLGLCDSCGNDLNIDPCGGHERENLSPFAVLEDFFEPES